MATITGLTLAIVVSIQLIAIFDFGGIRVRSDSHIESEKFGLRQLERMLEDRPDMQDALPSSHPLMARAIAGFDGSWHGHRVYWNKELPRSLRPAEHQFVFDFGTQRAIKHSHIAVTGGIEISPRDRWAMLLFEFFNLENSGQFIELFELALAGSINAEEYSTRCVELEFKALKKTSYFFSENPLPHGIENQDKFYEWILSDFGTFEDYREYFAALGPDNPKSNFKYFKDFYFHEILPFRRALRQSTQPKESLHSIFRVPL